MLELDRDRIGKSHHAPQLRVVPEQPAVSVHWNDLADAGNEAAYCSAWLSLQCARISGVTAGLVVVGQADKASPAVAASWPGLSLDGFGELSKLAERAFLERRTIISSQHACPDADSAAPSPVGHLVAIPLGAGGRIIAAAAVKLDAPPGSAQVDIERVVEQLRWGAGWLESLPLARRLEASVWGCGANLDMLGRAGRGRGAAAAAEHDDCHRQQSRHKTSM